MEQVVAFVDDYFQTNPPPLPLKHAWFGLTYINITWQEKMVSGMLNAFLGSFVVVFLMMTLLFRSPLWGLLCMIPLTVTIGFIYGVIGLIGKDYDMPVAVLSSLTLGLAVDFAIHFLARAREQVERCGSWERAFGNVFGAPARAIVRNVVVIVVGFTPLLVAPLTPYQTVGLFLAAIMAVSGIGTLIILPALVRLFQRQLFTTKEQSGVLQAAK
jgi:predicted RND superfamily exporter protein